MTISKPDGQRTLHIVGKYTGSSDKYIYIIRLRNTTSINGPVLASDGIDAEKKKYRRIL